MNNPYLHVAITTLVSFLTLWSITRILGKKQVTQLTLFDYITGITIGSMAAEVISPGDDWSAVLMGMVIWAVLATAFHWFDLMGRSTQKFLDGSPQILIRNGKVLEENLKKEQVTMEQLTAMLRAKSFFNISQVEFAVMETDGQLSVLPKSQYRPMRPQDLQIPTQYEGLGSQLMQEGRPLKQHLERVGLTEEWLRQELSRQGIKSFDEVFGAWLDTTGKLTVDRYKDGPH